jgi:hypothetical protein
MSPEIWLSGVVCTTGFNPRGLVQSSSENDNREKRLLSINPPFYEHLPGTMKHQQMPLNA